MASIANTLPFQRSQMSSELLLYEALDLIGSTIILGVSYGVAFTLYCLCAQSLYSQLHKPDQRRQTQFTFGYISFLLFCATSILALSGRIIQLAYINHGNSPGGPFAFEGERNSITTSLSLAGNVLELTIEVLTMTIQVCHRSQLDQQYWTVLIDPASVDNMEWNAICCSSHHPASTPPHIFYRYFDSHSWWSLHLIMSRTGYSRGRCLRDSTPWPPSHFPVHLQDHGLCELYNFVRSHNHRDWADSSTSVLRTKASCQGNGYVRRIISSAQQWPLNYELQEQSTPPLLTWLLWQCWLNLMLWSLRGLLLLQFQFSWTALVPIF